MFSKYFKDCEVRPEFNKEFISLWPGWLGEKNYHKLDEVTEKEWQRFNELISLISQDFKIELVSCEEEKSIPITSIDNALSSYQEAIEKDASQFSRFIIPELQCVLTEEWDYTYILWYKDKNVVNKMTSYIKSANLCHFS